MEILVQTQAKSETCNVKKMNHAISPFDFVKFIKIGIPTHERLLHIHILFFMPTILQMVRRLQRLFSVFTATRMLTSYMLRVKKRIRLN